MFMKTTFPTSKVAIIGAGAVGSTAAYATAIKNIASEIILIDINENKEKGEVMDMCDGMSFLETGKIKGGNFTDARDADIIVITAGISQKPGDTRLDLVNTNKKILISIFKQIGKIKKTTIVLLISNPVDILTHLAQKITRLPKHQVFGSGTGLDTARLRTQLAKKFKISAQDINGYVMGEHGDSEFVAWSTVSIGGISIDRLKLSTQEKKRIETSVRKEAYKIIKHKGATYYGIALVISDILEAILYDQHKIMPISTRLSKWNGVSDVCMGVPAVIGRRGVEKIWPVKLPADEKKKLIKSAKALKQYL